MTLLEPDVQTVVDGAERDLMAHITLESPADLLAARVFGLRIRAMCGKTWVPTRDPDRYPVCPTCVEIYEKRIGPWTGRR